MSRGDVAEPYARPAEAETAKPPADVHGGAVHGLVGSSSNCDSVSSNKVDGICGSACSGFVSCKGSLSDGNDGRRGRDISGSARSIVEGQLLNNQGARLVLAAHSLQVKAIAEPLGLTGFRCWRSHRLTCDLSNFSVWYNQPNAGSQFLRRVRRRCALVGWSALTLGAGRGQTPSRPSS
jgi:hypothetical protein